MSAGIDISLLVCTRDRHASLAATLASIARAAAPAPALDDDAPDDAPTLRIEAIVVDNGSTDGTLALLAAWRAAQPFPVAIVEEPRPGLARARNAGLARARGRIVAMTDDDCILDPGYFTWLARSFADAAGPVVIGGRITLGNPADLPLTVKLEDHPMVACPRAFPGGFVMGANLAFTADVPARIGGFDERFGAGAPFVAAEDTDLLFRALGAGIPVRYDPHFRVDHHHGRRHSDDGVRLLAGYSFGDGAMYAKHIRDARILAAIFRDLRDLRRDLAGETPWADIPRFHLFRLRHKIAGFLAYILVRRSRSAMSPAGGPGGAPASGNCRIESIPKRN